jgi:hypothetical protein
VIRVAGSVFICAANAGGAIQLPLFTNITVVIRIELVVDDRPLLRVSFGGAALADGPGAIATALRRIARVVKGSERTPTTGLQLVNFAPVDDAVVAAKLAEGGRA